MRELTSADEVWNRACQGGGDSPRTGDSALAALLRLHGAAVNGGVLHAIESSSLTQLMESQNGYRFFGFGAVADLLARASRLSQEHEDLEEFESPLNQEYWSVIPSDSTLVDSFQKHYEKCAQEYAPLD